MRNWHVSHSFYSVQIFIERFTLPMRNWHIIPSYSILFYLLKCFTLPMRNWHLFVPVLISFPLPQSFYITYEELTPNLCIVFDQCIDRVLHYLWGIDTIIANIAIMLITTSFTLLMRNWHSPSSVGIKMRSFTAMMFYITYEELTHSRTIELFS